MAATLSLLVSRRKAKSEDRSTTFRAAKKRLLSEASHRGHCRLSSPAAAGTYQVAAFALGLVVLVVLRLSPEVDRESEGSGDRRPCRPTRDRCPADRLGAAHR